ncbi:MAG: hypothetical protein U0736_12100 [Gemmataceae bacterium]
MPVRSCLWLFAAVVLALAGVARADLIFFKDGFVLQGQVRREYTSEFDPVSKDMTLIPKGFLMLDDGPRRMYFSPSQVRIAERYAAPAQDRVLNPRPRLLLNPRPLPPIQEVLEVGKWDFNTWLREYFFRSTEIPRVGLKQAVAGLTPYYIQVDASTKFRWNSVYLTREWDPDTVIRLLRTHKDFLPVTGEKPEAGVARRMRLVDFLAQAGWYDHAGKELDALIAAFPDQKERTTNARAQLDRLRARDEWEQIKNWYQAGRYQGVRQRLERFPATNAADKVLADLREMRERLTNSTAVLDEAGRALDECVKGVDTPAGRSLAAAVAVLRDELHPANVGRLDAFLGQMREHERQKAQGKKPTLTAEGLLSLAVSGWMIGSPSAEARSEYALNLWKTRQMLLTYLQEKDEAARKKGLAAYLKDVTPRVDLDEIAGLIDKLPPVQPGEIDTRQVLERRVGRTKRQSSYLLKLPPEYTHNRPYPVLIVLANAGEKAATMLKRWEQAAADHGYLLVAPEWGGSGVVDEYGYSEVEHDAVLDALRDVRQRYQIDSDRVFLFGLGEGAKMAFDVGLAHPDLFAGVLPMGAGPNRYARRYWRNAQYLPFYVVNGTRAGDSQTLLREQFEHWVIRGYPALWVEYKGRGTEFFPAEVPGLFDWMRHQTRFFPLSQVGTDGVGSQFGNEFCTLRPEDNRFYWLSTSGLSPRNTVPPERWSNAVTPATLTGRIDASTNEVTLKTSGLNQVTLWIGRNPAGQYMIDFEKPVNVKVGFTVYWNRKVTPSLEVLLEDLYERGDRKHLYLARIDINLR